ncbi:MAG TPA: YfcE family phosphodiesterase [Candidatus Polarisedimenticolia bacterium]|jgi:putative phosphoesterase|nr:YfcE family phosphodiesterase [Candidatus Polarisedimenticolia bacterium]
MKLIALGDIHGNLPALEVVLRECRAEGYDLIVHTGDLVGFAPFPNETVELVRVEKIEGVRGNLDESVSAGAEDFGGHGEDARTRRLENLAYAWTLERTERRARAFLADLPFEQRHEPAGRRTVVVHANPIDLSACMWEDRDPDYFREMGEAADADVLVFGHTHRPYHRIVDGRHFVNAGSVGYPKADDPRTGYVVINVNGSVEVQYRRFPYDVERLIRAMRDRRFPHDAEHLFKG